METAALASVRPSRNGGKLTPTGGPATPFVMLARVRAIYHQSKKPRDNLWTVWCSRPPAALVVWLLEPTSVTPNQVTFLSLAVFAGAAALLVGWRGYVGLVAAAAAVQLSYVLDCADGQLARTKNLASPVGALLDFLMDELKAFLLVGGCAVREFLRTGDARFLLLGVGGLVTVASGIALTTFMRREEYLAATGTPPPVLTGMATSLPRTPVGWIEWCGKQVIQYPQHFWIFCLANRLDIFLFCYLGANALYLGRASLTVLVKLGRPRRRS
jgi:phosphatidylglycerophosphate synthase